jgi:hypothetical protein
MFFIKKIISAREQLTPKELFALFETEAILRENYMPAIEYLERADIFPEKIKHKKLLLAYCFYNQGELPSAKACLEQLGIASDLVPEIFEILDNLYFPTFKEFNTNAFWRNVFKNGPEAAYIPQGPISIPFREGAQASMFSIFYWGYKLERGANESADLVISRAAGQKMGFWDLKPMGPRKLS